MMKQLGIVGLGLFAQDVHLPSLRLLGRLRGDFRIAAIADLDPERLAVGGRLWPEARRYASAEALRRAESLDGLFLFTPPPAQPPRLESGFSNREPPACWRSRRG